MNDETDISLTEENYDGLFRFSMMDGLKEMLLFVTDADGEIVGPDGVAITEDTEDEDDEEELEDEEDAEYNFTVSARKLRPGNILKILVRGKNESPDGGTRYWQLPIDVKIK